MKKLSLCMIVKNEEKRLAKALETAEIYADEIIVVDTGSTDKTKEVASQFTQKIFDFAWEDNFAKARNFSFDKANFEYIMWLDGDDIVPLSTAERIVSWKEKADECDVVMCPYIADFHEDMTPKFSYLRERIVKNSKTLRWHEPVHEVITPSGKIITDEEIKIYHGKYEKERGGRNLAIYQKLIKEGETLSPRCKFYYARELYFNNQIDEAIHQFSKFLAEGKGWKENNIEACLNLAHCYQINHDSIKALTSLFSSFLYDNPRSEILYEIGNVYFNDFEYAKAIYWYKLALEKRQTISGGGFVNSDCSTIFPALQLCVCYDKLGDKLEAWHYHEVAKAFEPNNSQVLLNEEYFKNIK